MRDQIEAVAAGARPADVLSEVDDGETITVDGEQLRVPKTGDPHKCPHCGADTALRTGFTWCGAIPPCQSPGGGERSHYAFDKPPAPMPRRRRTGRW